MSPKTGDVQSVHENPSVIRSGGRTEKSATKQKLLHDTVLRRQKNGSHHLLGLFSNLIKGNIQTCLKMTLGSVFLWLHVDHFHDLYQDLRYEHGHLNLQLPCAFRNALLVNTKGHLEDPFHDVRHRPADCSFSVAL